jgi:malate dehydrogenase (oxaloacetate-decarboxylating)
VLRICRAIADEPETVWNLTIKQNTVAVVTDGPAVVGLGDLGPEAALPVMEGKAILFKEFGGVDAWPICLATTDPDEIVRTVLALAPVFGAINLEDISAPRCFEIEARLRDELDIPVFHDDQHGTAIVVLASLLNALQVVGKRLEDARVVITGAGAAGASTARHAAGDGAGRRARARIRRRTERARGRLRDPERLRPARRTCRRGGSLARGRSKRRGKTHSARLGDGVARQVKMICPPAACS